MANVSWGTSFYHRYFHYGFFCLSVQFDFTIGRSFSIEYANNPDYVFEYYFSLDVNTLAPNSSVFWENLVTDCLANQTSWTEIYIPTAVTVIESTESEVMPLATNSVTSEMIDWLEKYNGNQSAYTGRTITGTTISGINLILYEDLTYRVSVSHSYIIEEALSISSFITGCLGYKVTSGLLGLLADIIGGNTIPAGANIKTYIMSIRWDRYVKRVSSSTWLNNTNKYVSFTGYYYNRTGEWNVDNSSTPAYSKSEAYFNSPSRQFTDAYNYYLTL